MEEGELEAGAAEGGAGASTGPPAVAALLGALTHPSMQVVEAAARGLKLLTRVRRAGGVESGA